MSKKELTALPTDGKKDSVIRTEILPFIGSIIIIAGFSYGIATFVRLFDNIPEFTQGIVAAFAILLILKIVSDKK